MPGLVHHARHEPVTTQDLMLTMEEAWQYHLYTPAGSASPSRQAPDTRYCELARSLDALLLLQASHHALHDWAHGLSSLQI